jgi:hypothetical protein
MVACARPKSFVTLLAKGNRLSATYSFHLCSDNRKPQGDRKPELGGGKPKEFRRLQNLPQNLATSGASPKKADVMKATSGMRDGNFSGRSFIETSLSAQIRVFLASKHKAPGDIPSRVSLDNRPA